MKVMMDRFIDTLLRFVPNAGSHLSDMQLADLFCGELSLLVSWPMRRHLATCAACRARKQRLEGPRAERMIEIYREGMERAEILLPSRSRAPFSMRLKLQLQDVPSSKWSSPANNTRVPRPSSPIPAVLTGAFAGLVAGVSIFSLLSWLREPNITANTLLVSAEKWDIPGAAAGGGVVRQTIQIKSAKQTLRRSIYWDVQGKRHPKQIGLSALEEQLRLSLGQAGIDWNRPISAWAYQDWHDHQHIRSDRIARSGAHRLKLTTAVPDGIVCDESLTVRDTDFHPIERKVDFRDHETVEIAEVDFAVLPWSAVDANIFEPEEGIAEHPAGSSASVLASSHTPEVPTPEQLDETELSARLVLNQHQADSGEQIEIHRLSQVIEVDGLVETDERKRQLTAELMAVPRLKVSIQSVTNLNENPSPSSDAKTAGVETATLSDQPSALEFYLRARGQTLNDINAFSERLFSSALTISQEMSAIVDLKTRFVPDKRVMPVLSVATLAELLYSHRERLGGALRQERALLSQVSANGPVAAPELVPATNSLTVEASRNLALARELTQTGAPNPRRAEAICAEMSATLDRMAGAADEQNGNSQQAPETPMNKTGSIR
jgi:hypothetical protein